MPATWEAYGVDANNDGRKDPYNPVDAICAAARYLNAAGGEEDLRTAIFAYNHADWYVDEVLLYANQYGKLPDDLVGSLTGLTEGARFPVAADARYADDISERRALERSKPGKRAAGNAAEVISSSPTRRGINIYSREGAPVVAVNDGVDHRDRQVEEARPLHRPPGRLRQPLHLRRARRGLRGLPGAEAEASSTADDFELVTPDDEAPTSPPAPARRPTTSAGSDRRRRRRRTSRPTAERGRRRPGQHRGRPRAPLRLPRARRATSTAPTSPASSTSCSPTRFPGYESFKAYLAGVLRFDRKTMELRPLQRGLAGRRRHRARPDRRDRRARPARPLRDPPGRPRRAEDRPEADPRRLEAARGDRDLPRRRQEPVRRRRDRRPDPADVEDAADRAGARRPAASRSTPAAARTSRPARSTAACWRCSSTWPRAASDLTITSLKCGHSVYTTSGNVSHHSSGNAVDIAADQRPAGARQPGPGLDHRSAGPRPDRSSRGRWRPARSSRLMDYFGADNTFAMGDHADHVHVGYTPVAGPGSGSVSQQFSAMLKPDQWERLIDRIGEIDNPRSRPSPPTRALPDRQGQGRQGPQAAPPAAHLARVAPAATLRFPFVQLELAGTVGLEDGRYLGRDPERGPGRPGRRRPAAAAAPARPREAQGRRPGRRARTVPVTTLTVIRPDDARRRGGRRAWLDRAARRPRRARGRDRRRAAC